MTDARDLPLWLVRARLVAVTTALPTLEPRRELPQ